MALWLGEAREAQRSELEPRGTVAVRLVGQLPGRRRLRRAAGGSGALRREEVESGRQRQGSDVASSLHLTFLLHIALLPALVLAASTVREAVSLMRMGAGRRWTLDRARQWFLVTLPGAVKYLWLRTNGNLITARRDEESAAWSHVHPQTPACHFPKCVYAHFLLCPDIPLAP